MYEVHDEKRVHEKCYDRGLGLVGLVGKGNNLANKLLVLFGCIL